MSATDDNIKRMEQAHLDAGYEAGREDAKAGREPAEEPGSRAWMAGYSVGYSVGDDSEEKMREAYEAFHGYGRYSREGD